MISTSTPITIAGAGLAGATIAHELAIKGFTHIDVFDGRDDVGGNCRTHRDPDTKVMVHDYGPHVFHTDKKAIWDYVNEFTRFVPYIQRTKARTHGAIYSFPINLHTINQFFDHTFSPREAIDHIGRRVLKDWDQTRTPENFEEMALASVGRELYEAFYRDYTVKQWGVHPTMIPVSVLARLPVRFTYDDNAFDHPYQGMPLYGYTEMIQNMLCHPSIRVHLGQTISGPPNKDGFHFHTGAIDEFYDYKFGELRYRTLDFYHYAEIETQSLQGCAVLNSCDLTKDWTRTTEHKHFTPWHTARGTIITREFSRQWQRGDIRYYPMRFDTDKEKLALYEAEAAKEDRVIFAGRLGTYRYLDMDKTIAESFQLVKDFTSEIR